jgi:uncharacterized membrane protein
MRMQSHLTENSPGETQVSVTSEVNVTGMLAQFGRGMIQDVSNQIFQRFSEAVRAELEREEAASKVTTDATATDGVASAPATEATPSTTGGAPSATPSSAATAPASAAATSSPRSAGRAPQASGPTSASAVAAPPSSGAPVSAPIDIVSVGSKALGRAAARSMMRPAVWVVLFLVILVLYWFIYR